MSASKMTGHVVLVKYDPMAGWVALCHECGGEIACNENFLDTEEEAADHWELTAVPTP